MKKMIVFLVCILGCIGLFAQADTLLNLPNVLNQATQAYNDSLNLPIAGKIFFFAAIIGTLLRIILSTYEGVKSTTNNSPMQFTFSYWIKDNCNAKIVVILTFATTYHVFDKISAGIGADIVFGISGLVMGFFIDYISEQLVEAKVNNLNKYKQLTLKSDIKN